MKYLLDTNTISQIMRKNIAATSRAVGIEHENLCVSSVSFAEIQYGLARKPEATTMRQVAELFLENMEIAPFDKAAADTYAQFRANLEKTGRNLAPLDLMIAAHAHHLGAILVFGNQRPSLFQN